MNNNFDIKYVYDIFHNDNNKVIIVMPPECKPPTIKHKSLEFRLHICPHNHTFIYESLIESVYKENIELLINNKLFNLKVNKYPEFKDEIIMSTMVHNEDDYIRQWIEYHINIGVSRFIIYDNSKIDDKLSYKSVEKNSDLKKVLSDFIEKGIVVLIEWSYPKRLKRSGISGQTTQQNHSIYAFRNSKYIGLFDIDEYVNMQHNTNINDFLELIIKNNNLNRDNIGSFRILNKCFMNPDNLSTKGYDFLSIFTCKEVTKRGREKNFVIPKNIETFAIHMITRGKKMCTINSNSIYFNHYMFLNKLRGIDKCNLQDKSILKHCNFIK